jgi:hypothetical protein
MNDEFDPLERELAALTPRGPSAELQEKLQREMRRDATAHRIGIAILALVAGAITAVFILIWILSDAIPTSTTTRALGPVGPTVSPATAPDDESQPTLQAYRRAISHSPEEFDALLDKQAASAGGASTMVHAFSRTDLTSIGEP